MHINLFCKCLSVCRLKSPGVGFLNYKFEQDPFNVFPAIKVNKNFKYMNFLSKILKACRCSCIIIGVNQIKRTCQGVLIFLFFVRLIFLEIDDIGEMVKCQ